ncbi:MAG: tRNA (N6-threonylcarbamoyladenosine(37)-N6)-methyltransferase TrmO [Dehalococcoidales bacterium]|nr:tRNA (N6-threonylcarbamoyladenosine(37)-N6)-methyltransferase TrmO [Dehalococcoidales bacterium]
MNFTPIGIVKSPVKKGVDSGWGNVISEIHVDRKYVDGLTGLSSFSHIIIIFGMHQSTWTPENDLIRRPQEREDMPLVGIFAQRAKHRPNPIGITSVRLLGVEANILRIQGLDAIDGTPVIDIKPYYPHYDKVDEPITPEWVDRLMSGYF